MITVAIKCRDGRGRRGLCDMVIKRYDVMLSVAAVAAQLSYLIHKLNRS